MIIDSPPLLPVTDAAVLSTVAGGTVVVVAAGMIKREDLTRSMSSLEAVQARTLGVVLNMLPTRGADAYGYYSGGYAPISPWQADGQPAIPLEDELGLASDPEPEATPADRTGREGVRRAPGDELPGPAERAAPADLAGREPGAAERRRTQRV